MVRKAAKDITPIFTVQMQTDRKNIKAFSLVEVIVAVFIISMLTMVAVVGYNNFSSNLSFKDTASQLVKVFEMATEAASQSERRYAVLIDFTENSFTLYDVNTDHPYNRDNLIEEDIITTGNFNDNCSLLYVQFDDSPKTIDGSEEGSALFVVGHGGWDYGGKIVLADYEGLEHTIIVTRLSKVVKMYDGDIELPQPEFDLAF